MKNIFKYKNFNSICKNKKYYSSTSEGTSTTQIIKKVSDVKGETVLQKINIIKKWSTMSRNTRIFMGVYGSLAFLTFSSSEYRDGKSELIKSRIERLDKKNKIIDYSQEESDESLDWLAVKNGCSENTLGNFIGCIFFPFNLISDAMPSLILYLNPSTDSVRSPEK